MNRYIAAAFSIAVAIGPASALDVGLGGKVGGIGVGAGLGLDKGGASVKGGLSVDKVGRADVDGSVGASRGKGVSADVGAGAKVDGVGGANLGASVDASRGSLDAGLSASGSLGDSSGSLGADVGLGGNSSGDGGSGAAPGNSASGSGAAAGGTTGGSAAGSGPSGGGSVGRGAESGNAASGSIGGSGSAASRGAATTARIGQTRSVRQSIHLPRTLWPSKAGGSRSARTMGYPLLFVAPLKAIPGTPLAVVRVCRQAIASAARPLGAVSVRAASAGPLSRQRRGVLTAPIQVRIDYAQQGRMEVRQARIRCRLDAAGRVIGVT